MIRGDLIEILRKMFEASSGKTTIEIKEKCSTCGNHVIIKITRTSGGFGVDGGALFKDSGDTYRAECENCYKLLMKRLGNFTIG